MKIHEILFSVNDSCQVVAPRVQHEEESNAKCGGKRTYFKFNINRIVVHSLYYKVSR